MAAETSQDERALRAELERAQERLSGLAGELRSVDAALESLATERSQHRLLRDACHALEALGELRGAALFWGDAAGVAQGENRLRSARGRIDAFEKRVGEIEDQRQALLDEIDRQQLSAEILEDDVLELMRLEEERKHEWVVERELADTPAHAARMPWTGGGEDEQRFRRSLAASLAVAILLGLVIPNIPLPIPEPAEAIEVPERLTRLLEAERRLPPPPPPAVAESKPEPERAVPEEAPRVAKEPTPQEAPQPGPGQGPSVGPAKGILAFREKLSGIAQAAPGTRLGLQARISSSGDLPSGPPERSLVTSLAPGSSGGINLASLSRQGGGGGGNRLAGVEVARATSSIGGGGGGRASGDGTAQSGGPALGRTDEEIQIVFDRHKSALYRLYNRELRVDPTLRGQIVLRMTIEPDGSVSLCDLHASDMDAPQLAAQVVERVRTFDFGAKDGIAAVTILYPIDFLPAT